MTAHIYSIFYQAMLTGLLLASLVAVWVFVSYLAARYSGRPWGLGSDTDNCDNGCSVCSMKVSCEKETFT